MKNSLRSAVRRGSVVGTAAVALSALLLSGCGSAPPAESGGAGSGSPAAGASDYLGCMVSDSGGFNDQSFNQSSHDGLVAAKKDLGIKTKQAESKAATDFGPNVNSMVQAKCDLTVTVGFLLADTTKAAAQKNKDLHFAIVDDNSIDLPNVKPIIYDTAQAAFMAGYLAAGTTKTGKVATFGGMKIPTVTIFMDGFADGVHYYNKQKNKDVQLLGWNKNKQEGTFTNDFEKQDKGKQYTKNFLNQGADIVLPVAGPVGLGAAAALKEAKDAGQDVKLIWVDSDGFKTTKYQDLMLSSVMKTMSDAVETVFKEDVNGKFDASPYVGTLENGGVALAPFHNYEDKVPAAMKKELDTIKSGIVDGSIKVESKASPKQ